MYGRLKAIYRPTGSKNPPCTVKVNPAMKAGKGDLIPLFNSSRRFLIALNGEKIYRDLLKPKSGYVNLDQLGRPIEKIKGECVGWGGNAVNIIGETEGFWKIEAPFYLGAFDEKKINFIETPWLVGKFTSIDPRGYLYKFGNGKNAYTPLFSTNKPEGTVNISHLWVEKTLVEEFPKLPVVVKPRLWGGSVIREAPNTNSPTIYKLPKDVPVTVVNYFLRGSEVWGAVSGGGFICLYYPYYVELMPFYSKQTTSWSMVTLPPPV